jgi:hypothetical protein
MHERNVIPSSLADSPLTGADHVTYEGVAMMPSVKVVKIGGQSIMDRGRSALFPLIEELGRIKDQHHLLLTTGGGTRARHVYAVASDLELPTGLLAALGGYVPRQNARMLQMLMAEQGGIYIMTDDFEKLVSWMLGHAQDVRVILLTGAGDAFVGAVLYQLDQLKTELATLDFPIWEKIIQNANKAGARTCEYLGAMEAFKHVTNRIFN